MDSPIYRIKVTVAHSVYFPSKFTEVTMTSGVGQVHVKRQRGKLVVIGFGVSPKGQKYIRASEEIAAKSPADPKFKGELATAVAKLLP